MEVSREEIDRCGVIYTVDTLHHLRNQMPQSELIYRIGADTLRLLDTWRRIDEVIGLCGFLVMLRPGEADAEAEHYAQRWRARGARIDFLAAGKLDISSTQVRADAAKGEPLPDEVPLSFKADGSRHYRSIQEEQEGGRLWIFSDL